MTPRTDIDRSIDRLDHALRRVGARGLAPASKTGALAEIAGEITPWELPDDLARLWERVDVGALVASAWRMPPLIGPRSALDAYREALGVGYPLLYGPPLLFPLAVSGESRWSVELRSDDGPAGMVFSHDEVIHLQYPGVADLVDTFAELIEAGTFERAAEGRLVLSDAAERHARDRRLGRLGSGAAQTLTNDPSGWPAHWLRSAGIDLRDREPLGRTHTIAELVTAARAGPVTGRIVGTVVRLAHVGEGEHLLVDDGTQTLGVWCPTGLSPWGPRHGHRYEFAVRLEEPPAQATDVRPLDA